MGSGNIWKITNMYCQPACSHISVIFSWFWTWWDFRQNIFLLWAQHSLQYLGVQLTSSIEILSKPNYPPLFQTSREDLCRWGNQSLSWFGRISSVKIKFLPRIHYYFRTVLESVTRGELHHLQVLCFIWGIRRSRMQKQILYSPKTGGGLVLPNLQAYF